MKIVPLLCFALLAVPGCRDKAPAPEPPPPPLALPPAPPPAAQPQPLAPPQPEAKPAPPADDSSRKVARELAGAVTTGECPRDDVLSAIRMASPDLRACYETQLKMQQALSSKVIVRWTISEDGRVADAQVVAATPGQVDFGRCVLDTVRRMTFARPASGTCTVQWPFVFSAG